VKSGSSSTLLWRTVLTRDAAQALFLIVLIMLGVELGGDALTNILDSKLRQEKLWSVC